MLVISAPTAYTSAVAAGAPESVFMSIEIS